MSRWTAHVLTLFPAMFPGPLAHSLAGKALQEGLWRLETVDIRGFARDKHRTVDDAPFGGGPGMVMRPDVVDAAIEATPGPGPLLYLSPRGRPLDQGRIEALAREPGVRLLCGRFRDRTNGSFASAVPPASISPDILSVWTARQASRPPRAATFLATI